MKAFIGKVWNFLFGKNLQVVAVPSLIYLKRQRKVDRNYFDYVRTGTLELIVHEIKKKNVEGATAELGVYKGKFARFINGHFPDKKMYLFDTFEGFDEKDKNIEVEKNYSGADQDFKNTSVNAVLSIMPHPENIIIKKGYFPETAEGLEEKFCLVSLDTDLYEPIYNGLRYFYPRLSNGGYIMIHDFNNDLYLGARAAVEQFCKEERLNFVPIPDVAGTCIICK